MYGMAGFLTWHLEHVSEYRRPSDESVEVSVFEASVVVLPLVVSSSTPMKERKRLLIQPPRCDMLLALPMISEIRDHEHHMAKHMIE